jgi:hypothetical protein
LTFKEFDQIIQPGDGNNGYAELICDFLGGRFLTGTTLLPVQCNGNTAGCCAGIFYPVDRT